MNSTVRQAITHATVSLPLVHCVLVFLGENMVPLVKRDLGFNVSHFRKVPTRDGGFKRYLVWMKDSLAANMPVIFIARIKGGNTRGVGASISGC